MNENKLQIQNGFCMTVLLCCYNRSVNRRETRSDFSLSVALQLLARRFEDVLFVSCFYNVRRRLLISKVSKVMRYVIDASTVWIFIRFLVKKMTQISWFLTNNKSWSLYWKRNVMAYTVTIERVIRRGIRVLQIW